MSLVASLMKSGLDQTDAERYAALIEDFSVQQAKLMAQLEAAGLNVSASVSLKATNDVPLGDAEFVARVRELLRPYGAHDADQAELFRALERLLSQTGAP